VTRLLARSVWRTTLLAMLLLGFAAAVCAAPPKPDRRTTLTRHLAALATKLKTAREPAERRALAEQMEWIRHQLGPTDASGRPVRCQAMWHDAALRDLGRAMKAFRNPAPTSPAADPVPRLKLAVREMASVALARAWADPDGPERFRFDAVGTYVATNVALFDGLLDRAAGHLAQAGRPAVSEPDPPPPPPAAPEPKEPAKTGEKADDDGGPAPPGFWSRPAEPSEAVASPADETAPPAASGREQALTLVQDGLGRLVRAAGQAHAADGATRAGRAAQTAARAAFVDALADVHRGTAALDAAGPAGEVLLPPEEAPGLTAEHKAALAQAAADIDAIRDPAWQGIRGHLETYLATAEQGLKYPKARREAWRLLEVVRRTAAYVQALLASKSASPEYVADRQETIAEALEDLGRRESRDTFYGRLLGVAGGDHYRKALDASPLSPEACRGLMALRQVRSSRFALGEKGQYRCVRFVGSVEAVIEQVDGDRRRPDAMDAHLATLYDQTAPLLRQAAETLGAAADAEGTVLLARGGEAAALAGDLKRLSRADRVIRGVRALMAERGTVLREAVVRRIEAFVLDPSAEKRAAREAFDDYLDVLRPLGDLRLPGKEHTAVAMQISGGAYRSAATRFGDSLTRNMVSAAGGNTEYLESTLAAGPMFTLLRHRAVADGLDLEGVALSRLDPFAMPPKPWAVFVPALDKRLAAVMRQYGAIRGGGTGASHVLGRWDRVYCTVVAAQLATHEAAAGAPNDLARLIRLLEQTAEPRLSTRVWVEWAAGFHTLEAAVCLMAGLPQTADAHLDALGNLRYQHRATNRLTGWAFDPAD